MKISQHVQLIRQKTASFDVDPQNGFSELCPAELPVKGALEIVPELNRMAGFTRLRVASRDWHPDVAAWNASDQPGERMLDPVGLPNVDVRWLKHCVAGTFGAEFLAGLPAPLEYDYVASKGLEADSHPYGACYHDLAGRRSTGVIEFLRCRKITTILVGGLATDFCVKTTVKQLLVADFRVVVVMAACRGIAEASTAAALEEMQQAGATLITSCDTIYH